MHNKQTSILSSLCVGLIVLSQSACDPITILGVGAGATAGAAATNDKGMSGLVSDVEIQAAINKRWMDYNMDVHRRLATTIKDGRVLITGGVQNHEQKARAAALVRGIRGVQEVLDEIQVGPAESFTGYASDTWTTTCLDTALLMDKSVHSMNYKVTTLRGTVYVLGTAQNHVEREAVLRHARKVKGVNQVISYIRIKGDGGYKRAAHGSFPANHGRI